VKYGAAIFPTEYAIDPATLGRALEDRGFESLWVAEHTHIPCSRESPWPGGADLPKMYYDLYSPFLALVAAATATRNLKVATGVCLVPQHDPIVLAKDVATIDRLSNGRFLFGVGGGWNREEMQNHGSVPFDRRWRLMRERIEAMKAIWTEERAEYHGDFVDFEPLFSWPKPVQRPHPPIHIAGSAPHALARAVRYGDGWIPILGRGNADLAADLRRLEGLAAEAGRSLEGFEVSIYACPTDPEKLGWLRDLRVARAVFLLPAEPAERVLPLLDRYAELARGVG
jgi:probable F420-dependent oxidoreductase